MIETHMDKITYCEDHPGTRMEEKGRYFSSCPDCEKSLRVSGTSLDESILDCFPSGGDKDRVIGKNKEADLTISHLLLGLEKIMKNGFVSSECRKCNKSSSITNIGIEELLEERKPVCQICNESMEKQKVRNVILEAPTGIGKSWIAATLALWKGGADILTTQKGLQEQYASDFKFMKKSMGKDNFYCLDQSNQEKCSTGNCKTKNPNGETEYCENFIQLTDFKTTHPRTENEKIQYRGELGDAERCGYWEMQQAAHQSSFTLYNFHSFIYRTDTPSELSESEKETENSKLLILDEAHDIGDVLASYNGLEIKDSYAKKVERNDLEKKINQIDSKTPISEVLEIIKELIIEYKAKIQIIKPHNKCSRYLFSKKHQIQHELQCKDHKNPSSKFTDECSACNKIKEFLNRRNGMRPCFSCERHIPNCTDKNIDHNKYNHLLYKSMEENLESLEEKYKIISSDLESGRKNQMSTKDHVPSGKSNFVISKAETSSDGKRFIVNIEPINVSKYADNLLVNYDHRIFMSATIDGFYFPTELGLSKDETIRIHLDSPFEKDKRRIIRDYQASLNYGNHEQEIKSKIVPKIEEILDSHKDVRGIILVTSYLQMKMILEKLSDSHKNRIMEFRKEENKESLMKEFKKTENRNKVAISPSFWYGYDFKDELSKFQIVVKAPFLPLGNGRIKRKKDDDQNWYTLSALQKLIQGCGRSIRNKDDSAITYLLDERIQTLLDSKHIDVPSWFMDALE